MEFILRSGDLDNRRTAGAKKEAMLAGGRLHRKIQKAMGADYRAEVSLKSLVRRDELSFLVEGRADGILSGEEEAVIDEIKCIYMDVGRLSEPDPLHLAQAMCYAYMYARDRDCSRMGVQVTYCNIETEEIRRFRRSYGKEDLSQWFDGLVGEYAKWARYLTQHRKERQESLKSLGFPYPYREGQKELAAAVYRCIARQKNLFIQAPTGVGKTLSTLFPSLKAMGEGYGEKLFYLTAKTITRRAAEEAFSILRERESLYFTAVTVTAKEKLCVREKAECNPDACPYAKGHFDRVNDAVYDMLTHTDDMSRSALEEYARRYDVCPFEMSLDLATWVDAVICDYNYVFDPNAHLKRFFGEGGKKEYLFLIDEAHNLVERGRAMYSAFVCKEDFLEVRRIVQKRDEKFCKALSSCNETLLALKRECDRYAVYESVSHIVVRLMNLMTEAERFMEECGDEEVLEKVRDLYFCVRDFLSIHDRLDENYLIYTEIAEDGRFYARLFCVNPAVCLSEYLNYGVSTVYFSATLLPIGYYKKLLSTETDDYAVYAHTPFPEENRRVLIGMDVTTRYTRRSREMYQRFAEYIWRTVKARPGNYIAFFPSYQFLEDVYEEFQNLDEKGEVFCVIQDSGMSEEEREEFLAFFEEERTGSLIGFCVMGGIFSEGIDLTEERLIGTWIVGTGLPQVCLERELLKQFFDEKGMNGFDYAYLYPGMNKVLQAAGRVIRTDTDRGMIYLLDDRFCQNHYRSVFPREWRYVTACRVRDVERETAAFWQDA